MTKNYSLRQLCAETAAKAEWSWRPTFEEGLRSKRSGLRRASLATFLGVSLLVSGWSAQASPAQDQKRPADLAEASLETLLNLEVTSASKKQHKLSQTAAAIYVITQEDIRRSGANTIPDLLRMVPGLDVANVDANIWAISSRGFNDRSANKLLVLIDGRTVYSPLFSGVFWDVQDTLLEDIDRIEVIRGPGASLWGANAVNGVISIITKRARDTQGGLVTAVGGNQEQGLAAVRYGGQLGSRGQYRAFVKGFNRAAFQTPSGQSAADDWNTLRGGFRSDWDLNPADKLTVQGDLYRGNIGENIPAVIALSPPLSGNFNSRTHVSGGNLLGRWDHVISTHSDTSLQLYYDYSARADGYLGEILHTVDVDFQHHFILGSRHDLLWGFGFRLAGDDTQGSLAFSFTPDDRLGNLFSVFVQDEIALQPDKLRLTLGAKLERSTFAEFAFQPNLRLLWTPHPRHVFWAGVSFSTRSPSRVDREIRVSSSVTSGPGGTPVLIAAFGTPEFEAEELIANELGYRADVNKSLSLDLSFYENVYEHLRAGVLGTPFLETNPAPPHQVIPLEIRNRMHGHTRGLEFAPTWRVNSRWKLTGGYAWFNSRVRPDLPEVAAQAVITSGQSPQHQASLRSYLSLPGNLDFDTSVYLVSRLPAFGVPAHARVDSRLAWRPAEFLELSVVGQNLQRPHHAEFGSTGQALNATQVRRSIFGKVTWRF